jgi:hypothetical protein
VAQASVGKITSVAGQVSVERATSTVTPAAAVYVDQGDRITTAMGALQSSLWIRRL